MHARHRKFWRPAEIQQFWSGKSFLRADEGNELSYDLARILVSQLGSEWGRFRPFVLSANAEDSGASAAAEHLGIHLGEAITALLEQESSQEWAPNAALWSGVPERGAFRAGTPSVQPLATGTPVAAAPVKRLADDNRPSLVSTIWRRGLQPGGTHR